MSLGGCASIQGGGETTAAGPQSKVFFASYEQVWRAAQLALARYPMRINNMDIGLLETDLIGGANAWHPPGSRKRIPNAQAYIIRLQVIKGESYREKAIKVVVEKIIRIKKNFFSDYKFLETDGLEESVLLYRTGRILTIERAIDQALKERDAAESESADF